jgi:putative redox protein
MEGSTLTKATVYYEDNLRVKSVLHPDEKILYTDAPKNVGGKGEHYSPTDLLGSAFGACLLTMMGIEAKRRRFSIEGAYADIEKSLTTTPPYKVSTLHVTLFCPDPGEENLRTALIKAAHSCPIHHSLHPEIEKTLDFQWT